MNGIHTGWTTDGTSNSGRVNTFVSIPMRSGALWEQSSLKRNGCKRLFARGHEGRLRLKCDGTRAETRFLLSRETDESI